MSLAWEQLKQLATAEIAATIQALPPPLRQRAQPLPVTLEASPSPALQAEGIAPDTLGLFTGPAFDEELNTLSPLPPQIILFLTNLWDFAAEDEADFRAEVRTTYLHELGHYLGLDEDDLAARGLD